MTRHIKGLTAWLLRGLAFAAGCFALGFAEIRGACVRVAMRLETSI